jgi:hypothetical protein
MEYMNNTGGGKDDKKYQSNSTPPQTVSGIVGPQPYQESALQEATRLLQQQEISSEELAQERAERKAKEHLDLTKSLEDKVK